MFRDLNFEFMGSIHFKNPARLRRTFNLHSTLILMIKKCSPFQNNMIGLFYYMFGIMIVFQCQVVFSEDATIFQRLSFILQISATLSYAFLVSLTSGWIVDSNRKLARFIYEIYSKDNIKFWKKYPILLIRMDEFMSEIFGTYVGFKCFVFSNFTKVSSYQFFLNLGSWYILLKNLNEF